MDGRLIVRHVLDCHVLQAPARLAAFHVVADNQTVEHAQAKTTAGRCQEEPAQRTAQQVGADGRRWAQTTAGHCQEPAQRTAQQLNSRNGKSSPRSIFLTGAMDVEAGRCELKQTGRMQRLVEWCCHGDQLTDLSPTICMKMPQSVPAFLQSSKNFNVITIGSGKLWMLQVGTPCVILRTCEAAVPFWPPQCPAPAAPVLHAGSWPAQEHLTAQGCHPPRQTVFATAALHPDMNRPLFEICCRLDRQQRTAPLLAKQDPAALASCDHATDGAQGSRWALETTQISAFIHLVLRKFSKTHLVPCLLDRRAPRTAAGVDEDSVSMHLQTRDHHVFLRAWPLLPTVQQPHTDTNTIEYGSPTHVHELPFQRASLHR
eukprot:366318-Chlamydomonas_euryale.AAC.8